MLLSISGGNRLKFLVEEVLASNPVNGEWQVDGCRRISLCEANCDASVFVECEYWMRTSNFANKSSRSSFVIKKRWRLSFRESAGTMV